MRDEAAHEPPNALTSWSQIPGDDAIGPMGALYSLTPPVVFAPKALAPRAPVFNVDGMVIGEPLAEVFRPFAPAGLLIMPASVLSGTPPAIDMEPFRGDGDGEKGPTEFGNGWPPKTCVCC
jgi:hypothetical protein